jgi:hypothetical protein
VQTEKHLFSYNHHFKSTKCDKYKINTEYGLLLGCDRFTDLPFRNETIGYSFSFELREIMKTVKMPLVLTKQILTIENIHQSASMP